MPLFDRIFRLDESATKVGKDSDALKLADKRNTTRLDKLKKKFPFVQRGLDPSDRAKQDEKAAKLPDRHLIRRALRLGDKLMNRSYDLHNRLHIPKDPS